MNIGERIGRCFVHILQTQRKYCQSLAKVIVKFRGYPLALLLLCIDQHATELPFSLSGKFQLFSGVQKVGCQSGKNWDNQNYSGPNPLGSLPETWRAKKYDTSSRKPALRNMPTLQFIPVEHEHTWKSLDRQISGFFPFENLRNNLGRDLSLSLKIHQVSADDTMSQISI